MSKQRRVNVLPLQERLRLLKAGLLSDWEVANLAADCGTENYIEAKDDLEKLLDHPNATVRFNSLASLAYEWGDTSRTQRIAEIAFSDPDRECRRQAAGALGSLFRGSRNAEILDTLAGIARRSAEADDVRAFAYTAALDVLGIPRTAQPTPTRLRVGEKELSVLNEKVKGI